MSKLLLVGPTQNDAGTQNWGNPSIGLNRLSQYIRNNSVHNVDIWDSSIDGDINPQIFENYTHIGMSPTDYTLIDDIKLMNQASEINPQATLIAGGVNSTLDPETLLRKTRVEYIAQGYGEIQLLSILNGENNIQGVIHRTYADPITDEELTDWMLDINWSTMGYERYWAKTAAMYSNPDYDAINTVRLVTTSHCNKQCSFCSVRSWSQYATGKFCHPATLNSDALITLTKHIIEDVPRVKTIYFCEDDFMQYTKRVEQYMEYTKTTNLRYLIQTHSSRIKDEATVRMLADGRVKHITMGIESVIPRVLKTMNKVNDIEKLPEIIKWCVDAGITPYLLIILFAQFITLEELMLTIKILRKYIELGATVSINSNLMPYKGSTLYDTDYEAETEIVNLGGGINNNLKRETIVLCDDIYVRAIQKEFNKRLPEYIEQHTVHQSKDLTGTLILDLMEEIINTTM